MPIVLAKLDEDAYFEALEKIRRGRVLKVDLSGTKGLEAGGDEPHPCVVVSTDAINRKSSTIVVVPITGHSGGQKPTAYEVPLLTGDAELTKDCFAQPDQVRTIDKTRVREVWGVLPEDFMLAIEDQLAYALDIGMSEADET